MRLGIPDHSGADTAGLDAVSLQIDFAELVQGGGVLPGAAVAIHHGGAGTVHTAARAGIPSIVVPFIADQPFWGRRLHRLGLAPRPIPYRRLSRDRLTRAIEQPAAGRVGALLHRDPVA